MERLELGHGQTEPIDPVREGHGAAFFWGAPFTSPVMTSRSCASPCSRSLYVAIHGYPTHGHKEFFPTIIVGIAGYSEGSRSIRKVHNTGMLQISHPGARPPRPRPRPPPSRCSTRPARTPLLCSLALFPTIRCLEPGQTMSTTSRDDASTAFVPTARYVGLRHNRKLGLPGDRSQYCPRSTFIARKLFVFNS
ncbi:hypothetical protein B0H12DRAFT_413933 [Mycena haematopus]|nr:hypothetical protein B0H12DRAFT_413933 [Mycena haematopus]